MQNRKILIIEDEITFCTILKTYLESLDIVIYTANNGLQAIEMLTIDHIEPDIILCDLNMPVMDGEAFMRELVARNITIPVIVISATTDFTQLDRMFRLGAKDALLKPIKNLDEIKITIFSALYPEKDNLPAMIGGEIDHVAALMQSNTPEMLTVLKQLQPPVHQIINDYRINYRQLNEANRFGLLLDLAPISNNQIGFYCIDTERSPQEGIMAAFLIRVVFNNLLKNAVSYPDKKLPNINKIINQINHLLEDSGFSGQFPLLLGYFNTQNKAIILASAGLDAEVTTEESHFKLDRSIPLGTLKYYHPNHLEIKGTAWQCLIRNNSQKIKLMFNPEN